MTSILEISKMMNLMAMENISIPMVICTMGILKMVFRMASVSIISKMEQFMKDSGNWVAKGHKAVVWFTLNYQKIILSSRDQVNKTVLSKNYNNFLKLYPSIEHK